MTTIQFGRVAGYIRAAGFFAHVEHTGGGVATMYASTEADENGNAKPVVPPPQPILYSSEDYPRYHVSFGPGAFDADGRASYSSEHLSIGADDNGSTPSTYLTRWHTSRTVARIIISRLRRPTA